MYRQVPQFCPQREEPGGEQLLEIIGNCAITKSLRRLWLCL